MSHLPKLMLSDEEQQLVQNSGWILTKRIIIDKAVQQLALLSAKQQLVIENEKAWLPAAVTASTAKISKGENYLQLPYVLLDYPRCFDAENIFAVRTMFWWGNFFSITLQLSGMYKERYQQKIIERCNRLSGEYFIGIHASQWQHHFMEDNYVPVSRLTDEELQDIIEHKPFIKLAVKYTLAQWNDAPGLLYSTFIEMIEMLRD